MKKLITEISIDDIGECYKLCDVPRGIGYIIFKEDNRIINILDQSIKMAGSLQYNDIFLILESVPNLKYKILSKDIVGWIFPSPISKSSIEKL